MYRKGGGGGEQAAPAARGGGQRRRAGGDKARAGQAGKKTHEEFLIGYFVYPLVR